MDYNSKEILDTIIKTRDTIRLGLKNSFLSDNLLIRYEEWKQNPSNSFDSVLYISNPFILNSAGERQFFRKDDPYQMIDLDIICMSIFLSDQLVSYEKQIIDAIKNEKNKQEKINIVNNYSLTINNIIENKNLSFCIICLNEFANKQAVLFGKRAIDMYSSFYLLKEILRRSSINSIFLYFTYWRLTNEKKHFKLLINSIVDYIQSYYSEFNKDPDMRLYQSLEGLLPFAKLRIVYNWLKLIAFHTEGILEEYKKKKWLYPSDVLADNTVITNQISKYTMMAYKTMFPKDDNNIVKQKAICYHSYGIWIKTTDLLYIISNVFRLLSELPDEELKKYHTSKKEIYNLYDCMDKICNRYTSKLFSHKVFYLSKNRFADYQVMEAFEEDSELFSSITDDIITIISSVNSDNIEDLLQAKQQYLSKLDNRITDEQTKKIEEIVLETTKKIKENIQKMNIYDELYASVSRDFSQYAIHLMQFPQLFSTLVSAEYLYNHYVDGKSANDKFDYSGISIMYYLALEDFINTLIYKPYYKTYLSNAKQEEWKDFVTHKSLYWDKRNRQYKSSCEIGNLGHLLECIFQLKAFKEYINTHFKLTDFSRISDYGSKLIRIANRRNEAAHGGNIITYDNTVHDKMTVYNSTSEYRGMILELLSILYYA